MFRKINSSNVRVLICCDTREKCRKYETSAELHRFHILYISCRCTTGRAVLSVTCLATDACLTTNPGLVSLIPARSHTFLEIDHEIFSMVILLLSAESFKKGCCQFQAKVCAQSTV